MQANRNNITGAHLIMFIYRPLLTMFCTIRVFCPIRIWDVIYAYRMVLLSHKHMGVLYAYSIEIAKLQAKQCNKMIVNRIELCIASNTSYSV